MPMTGCGLWKIPCPSSRGERAVEKSGSIQDFLRQQRTIGKTNR
jgi:hypothetical protein